MSTWRYGAVTFMAGAGALATEICASRLLAPYFGSSTIVWANVIGLILIYLAVGYWVGGRIADRWPTPRHLGGILVAAAVCIAALPFAAHPVLDLAVRGFDGLSAGAVVGSFFAALALFSVPVTLLGTVSPYVLRLSLHDLSRAGTVAGRLSSLATLGAIAGTFIPALLSIPAIGTQRTLLASATLVAAAAALLLRRAAVVAVAIGGLIAVPPGAVRATAGVIFERESPYQYVSVVQEPDGSRQLILDDGFTTHSVWRANTVLTGGEWDMFLVLPPLLDTPAPRVLVIGNAAGTQARAFGALYPRAVIDGVEIDPVVTEAGERYMGLHDNPNLHVITDDGRPYLMRTSTHYDLVIVDAYRQPYVPFYLATQEFFSLVRDHLNPGGIVALNAEAVPGDTRLQTAIEGTLASVLPQAWGWQPLRFNELVIGMQSPQPRSRILGRVGGVPAAVRSLVPLFRSGLRPLSPASDPLTDDHAPVEWLTDRAIIEYIAHGGRTLDEQLMPTYPG